MNNKLLVFLSIAAASSMALSAATNTKRANTAQMTLYPGWNMISSPVNGIKVGSDYLAENGITLYSFNVAQNKYETPDYIQSGIGYWAQSKAKQTLYAPEGRVSPDATADLDSIMQNATPNAWNLLGVSFAAQKSDLRARGATAIWWWDTQAGAYSSNETLNAGNGMWLKKSLAATSSQSASSDELSQIADAAVAGATSSVGSYKIANKSTDVAYSSRGEISNALFSSNSLSSLIDTSVQTSKSLKALSGNIKIVDSLTARASQLTPAQIQQLDPLALFMDTATLAIYNSLKAGTLTDPTKVPIFTAGAKNASATFAQAQLDKNMADKNITFNDNGEAIFVDNTVSKNANLKMVIYDTAGNRLTARFDKVASWYKYDSSGANIAPLAKYLVNNAPDFSKFRMKLVITLPNGFDIGGAKVQVASLESVFLKYPTSDTDLPDDILFTGEGSIVTKDGKSWLQRNMKMVIHPKAPDKMAGSYDIINNDTKTDTFKAVAAFNETGLTTADVVKNGQTVAKLTGVNGKVTITPTAAVNTSATFRAPTQAECTAGGGTWEDWRVDDKGTKRPQCSATWDKAMKICTLPTKDQWLSVLANCGADITNQPLASYGDYTGTASGIYKCIQGKGFNDVFTWYWSSTEFKDKYHSNSAWKMDVFSTSPDTWYVQADSKDYDNYVRCAN